MPITNEEFEKMNPHLPYKMFEIAVAKFLTAEWGVELKERPVKVGETDVKFDLVSDDGNYIGDAKYMKNIPSAKWSNISEYVWLLQQTKAENKFLIFGKDREIPERYLKRWSSLMKDVVFYFFDGKKLEKLL